ncbi:MAG: bifunctional demethylmenaquinone methyltransferase/2-methoxy-6-polyprenyl-1,4-benzoquinol methylase UbiE [Mucispirillum sp.]|nr:bifunctional demethylmenaquinone methyltransferase/2-methoxy-6-polyprenyl-1,4-benzoquinol methylase UbiE [Mucispirillum sp.]
MKNKEQSEKVREIFNAIAGKYDFLNGILSMSFDNKWRRFAIRAADIKAEHCVLDLACGTGALMTAIKEHEPKCMLYGADFSVNMLKIGRNKVGECPLTAADAQCLPFKESSFDRITMAFGFRNVADKELGLAELFRVVKKDGKVCILELTPPENTLMGKLYKFYFKYILPLIGGIFSSRKAYAYLPDSVAHFPKRDEYKKMIEKAGFKHIHFKPMFFGAVTIAVMEK